MKKILIFYAAYGGGHLSAAKSIKQYIDENYEDVETELIDCVKYVDIVLEKVTTDAYKDMAKKAPWAWERVYKSSQKGFLSKVSTTANKIMAVKIAKLFREKKPDIVISTHPFGSQMTAYLKQKGKTNCTLATVLTDYAPHVQWLIGSNFVDYFFVSNDNMKKSMVKNNEIPEYKIYVTGIPISKRFLQVYDREKICESFGLDKDKRTILFFAGGEYGLGKDSTISMLNALAKTKYDIQVIAIAGKNEKMKQAFEEIVIENNKTDVIKVLPFTDKVPELMSISNLVITKPGGLTTTESLASGLPILVINPIPGQEEENAEFLENAGCAIWLKKNSKPEKVINDILSNENKLNEMKESSIKLSKRNSTKDICNICLKEEK